MTAQPTTAPAEAHATDSPLDSARAAAALFCAKSVDHERQGRLSDEALSALKSATLFGPRARPIERAHISATHLAMHHMAWASTAAAEYASKAGGGVSLREGPLQRAFRDTLAGRQHVRVSTAVLRACARDLLAVPKRQE